MEQNKDPGGIEGRRRRSWIGGGLHGGRVKLKVQRAPVLWRMLCEQSERGPEDGIMQEMRRWR